MIGRAFNSAASDPFPASFKPGSDEIFATSPCSGSTAECFQASWRDALFAEVSSATDGEIRYAQRYLCIARYMVPMDVQTDEGAWTEQRAGCRLLQPGTVDHLRCLKWRGPAHCQFLLIAPDRLEPWGGERLFRRFEEGHAMVERSLVRAMEALQTELSSRGPHPVLLGDGLVSGLLSYLASARGDRPLVMLGAALHSRLIEFIEAKLDQTLLLSELADYAGVGERHFLRAFRGSTGMTPHQYVLWRRVERAKRLIDGGLPLSAVSQACGFGDQSQLTRLFARRFGVTPGRYRTRSATDTG